MKKIYKYELEPFVNTVTLPKYSKILSVAPQRGNIVLYVLVDTDITETREIEVRVYGTGHNIYSENFSEFEYIFIGTCSFDDGKLMLHVFIKE